MNLSNYIFEKFFWNKISQEELLKEIEVNSPEFEKILRQELENVMLNKDKERLEYLIYSNFPHHLM